MFWDTAANNISNAARELGLVSAAIADPYASTDANVLLLNVLLNRVGQRLTRQHPWAQLQATHTFNTASGSAAYEAPAGFDRPIDGTHWNRDSDVPLLGPATPQDWALLKAIDSSGTAYHIFRRFGGGASSDTAAQLVIHPTPTSTIAMAFEYQSRFWVATVAGQVPTLAAAAGADDEIWHDAQLVVDALKLEFLKTKGLPRDDALADYRASLEAALSANAEAPVLNLGGPREESLIDISNLPDGGYGA